MMKILYVTDFSGIGGGEKSLLYLCESAILAGDNVAILSLFPGKLNLEADKMHIPNKALHASKVSSRGWYKAVPIFRLGTIIKLYRYIAERKPDLVHVYSSGRMLSSLVVIHKMLGLKVFWTCHGAWERPFGFKKFLLNSMVKKIFFVSEYVRKCSTFDKKKEVVSYLGVPPAERAANTPSVRSGKICIAVIGRYQEIKNQMLVVNFLEKYPCGNLVFMMIGGSEFGQKKDEAYRQSVLAAIDARKLGEKILTHPYQENVFDYYTDIDFLLVPSKSETFSLVIAEALVRGIPVIATKNGGPSEILADGKYGFVFDPENVESLKAAIDMALVTPLDRDALVQRGRDFSSEKYYSILRSAYNE